MIYFKFLNVIILIILQVTLLEAWKPLKFVEFNDWATNATLNPSKVEFAPVFKYVMISKTFSNECFSLEECSLQLNLQLMKNISENFYVGGDGTIYVGLGWNSNEWNNFCDTNVNELMIEISFIGDFEDSTIPAKQLRAAQRLLEHGLLTRKLSKTYELFGEWEMFDTLDSLYGNDNEILETWPHWTANPSYYCF